MAPLRLSSRIRSKASSRLRSAKPSSKQGVDHRPRAKSQHLGHIDRRGALVRDSIHRIVGQLKTESVKWKPALIVDEAMLCTNAMLTINGHSPYTAVFGRVPHFLPDLNVLPDEDGLHSKSGTTLRQFHRIHKSLLIRL